MTEDERLSQEIKDGSEAKQLLSNRLYTESMISYKAQLFDAFCNSKDNEMELRESIYRQMKSLRQVESNLNTIVTTGKLALEQINRTEEII